MSEKYVMDIEDIKKILPHRYPFLLIDRVLEMEPGKSIKALKNVTVNEPCFQGHFPTYSVMPGVLLTEIMAQAAGIFMLVTGDYSHDKIFFTNMDRVRFKKPVVPGDTLIIEAELEKLSRGTFAKFQARVKVDDKIVCSGEFMAALVKEENNG